MKARTKNTLVTIYAIGAIATFGHAWNRDFSATLDPINTAVLVAPVAAVVWPLYWSTVVWKEIETTP